MKSFNILLFTCALCMLSSALTGQICAENYASQSGISGINFSALWTDVQNIEGMPDDAGISIIRFTPLSEDVNTSRIGVSDFGFQIPCNAVVTDLSFDILRRNNAVVGDIRDEEVFLKMPDFSFTGNNAAVNAPWSNQTTGWETFTYNPSIGWGVTLTPDIVNDPIFGLLINVKNFGPEEGFPEMDAVLMRVCYTVNGMPYEAISATIDNGVNNFCNAGTDGSITITATGGTGDYEYSNDNGVTWSASNSFTSVESKNYHIRVRDTNGACSLDLGAYYVGCNPDKILQVGDAIYTCRPTENNNVTLAIDRIQPLHDLYVNGQVGVDVSPLIQKQAFTWTASDLGGVVYGVTFDNDFNIYTGISTLYSIIGPPVQADLIKIDALNGVPTVIATLPGEAGIGQVEYHAGCDQLYVTNLDDGTIYRYDTAGNLLSVFDPLMPDDGVLGLSALGERIVALSFNEIEDRLYYSVWSNDRIDNGTRNTIRSVSIDPSTCDFVIGSDLLEVSLPFISETAPNSREFSHPVLDLEFNQNGNILLVSESGFNSTIPLTHSHEARLLRYDGASSAWALNNTTVGTNTEYKYEIGSVSNGTNSLGGVDFAYAGIDEGGCTNSTETFIAATGDALLGVDCTYLGCLYGLQFMPIEGGDPTTSVLVDFARNPASQQKGFFGDLDIVTGCCPCSCEPVDFSLNANDLTVCAGEEVNICVEGLTLSQANYTYSWASGEDSSCIQIFPTSSMDYTVQVTDGENCTGVETISISVAEVLEVDNILTTDSNSCVTSNGSIMISTTGGALPLTFSIDGGMTTQNSNEFQSLMAGEYMLVVTDSYGCSVQENVTILGPTDLILDLIVDDQTSCDFPNGGISVAVTGGTAPYTFSIDGGNTFSPETFFSNLEGGMYAVEVLDAVGCPSMAVVQIGLPICYGSVGDFVFEDIDGDGVQDPGESGIADVKVELYNDNGVLVSILYTDDTGHYLFEDVAAGDYYIKFITPEGFNSTTPHASGNTSTDSNVDDSNGIGTTPLFSINSGDMERSIDYGVYKCIQIGELIWFDSNENDLFEDYENGINGVKVEIYKDINGLWELEDFTYSKHKPGTPSDDGYYKFCVAPGRYYVKYNLPPGRFVTTIPNQGNDEARDSDITDAFSDGSTDAFIVRSGEELCTIAGGFYLEATIGDYVWFDDNQNGSRDIGEKGLENIMVQAIDLEGSVISTTTSNENGEYLLGLLGKGAYYVKVSTSDDYKVTLPNEGNDDTTDSDIDNSNGPNTSALYEMLPGEHMANVDIGIVYNPLSVEWLGISGNKTADGNLVEWSVTSEINVSHYVLQRSYGNTKNFVNLSQVASIYGNSSLKIEYNLTDIEYAKGNNYYRIEQHELDGRVSYSDIVAINNESVLPRSGYTLSLYPNPNAGLFQLELESPASTSQLELFVYNVLGELVYNKEAEAKDLTNLKSTYEVDLEELSAGIYMIEVIVDTEILIQKFTINK